VLTKPAKNGKASPLFFAVFGYFVRRLSEVFWKNHPPDLRPEPCCQRESVAKKPYSAMFNPF
jgi:hypothetical protein